MADFAPNVVRSVAIEVKESVQDLYVQLLPLLAQINRWTLHCQNAALPDPFSVRVALEQYQALKIRTLELRTWIADIKTAADGDGLSFMPPCAGVGSGVFDGSSTFDGSTTFNGE